MYILTFSNIHKRAQNKNLLNSHHPLTLNYILDLRERVNQKEVLEEKKSLKEKNPHHSQHYRRVIFNIQHITIFKKLSIFKD